MKPRGIGWIVVVMVVNTMDFDDSFPRRAAKMLNTALCKSRVLRLVSMAKRLGLLTTALMVLSAALGRARATSLIWI
ncbi:hypothetical protein SUGI_0552420 [Cryptomeria japonica]|nr:hypothetical protein SUGI_0552420 [Cryptomeria japonica]